MRWKPNDEMLLLVWILDLKDLCIIPCVRDKMLHNLFCAEQAFVSCRTLNPSCGLSPWSPPTLGRSSYGINSVATAT